MNVVIWVLIVASVIVIVDLALLRPRRRRRKQLEKEKMLCPNCGKEQVDNARFCHNCGANLVQQSAMPPDIKPHVEPTVNQGVQPRPRSIALKSAIVLLFALAVWHLILTIDVITVIQRVGIGSIENLLVLGVCTMVPLNLVAAIYAAKKQHWRFVLGVAIWVPIAVSTDYLAAGGLWPGFYSWLVIIAGIACIVLIFRARTEFSSRTRKKALSPREQLEKEKQEIIEMIDEALEEEKKTG